MLHLQVNLTTSSLQRLIVSQKQELRSQFRSSSDIYFTVPTIYTVLKNCNYKWTGKAYFKIYGSEILERERIYACVRTHVKFYNLATCMLHANGYIYDTCLSKVAPLVS